MDNCIPIGIVGGGFGRYGLIPAFRRDPRCCIVAICTQSNETAAKIAVDENIPRAFSDFSKMLLQVPMRAVAIAAPPHAQERLALAALEAGIAVFAEKPLAGSLSAAQALLARAEASGVSHVVDFIFPELTTWRHAHELIQTGKLGRIRHVMLDWRMESYDIARRRTLWKVYSDLGGGALAHFGSHALYNIEWFLGRLFD